ncbi:ImcF-related family protein [Pandoraea oxalativorans]|uniref:ImcF-related family protein n=1 Tax=Pandoraea oxalativorans TaxID=573737 RepID=UPI001FE212F2|nr:ImcF-related family protein [Pandoraea oxalativorans]
MLYVPDELAANDREWLTQIRRLRRRRPIDAVVALTAHAADGSAHTLLPPETLASHISRFARALRWAAPVYLLDVTDQGDDEQHADDAIGLTWTAERVRADGAKGIEASLTALSGRLADAGVARLSTDATRRTAAGLAQHIARMHSALSALVSQTAASRFWRHSVHGLLFAPLGPANAHLATSIPETQASQHRSTTSAVNHRKLWDLIGTHSRKVRGRRVGLSLSSIVAWTVTAVLFVWILGVNLSGLHNRAANKATQDALALWHRASDQTQQMQALDNLGRQMDTFEVREREGAPWSTRFGLNQDSALLNAMWPQYVSAARTVVLLPVKRELETRLMRLTSLSDAEIADSDNVQADAAHNTLEAYLMLANTAHANADLLKPLLLGTQVPLQPHLPGMSPGAWSDLRSQTLAFMASHLGTTRNGISLATPVDQGLVDATRQTIISVRGIQNSADMLYDKIVEDAQAKYPPVTLASLLGDTSSRGLFTTTHTLPGVFTRAAYEERISRAIDDASRRQDVTGDWVLSDVERDVPNTSALEIALRQRYFDDFARAWADFLNSLRWQHASSLTGTVDQLLLLGDPQRSPMVALMEAINYQANTGVTKQSLADGLLDKAHQLVGRDVDPSLREPASVVPLANAFGPILRLTGRDLTSAGSAPGTSALAGTSDLTLARYLERTTAMRLRLQQMASAPDPDAMARIAAQAVLQGKTSEIADSRDYATRVAASLGGQWAGFGAVLQAPLDQAWQVVVQPAAANLNEIWRNAVVADWQATFGGRYPFADSDNDASLPEMARFMRPDGGVVAQFVATQLAGVIERQGDRWVATQGPNQGGLSLDPQYLVALNRLTRAATVMFPSGDGHVRFELRGVPAPGITDVRFVLSGRNLHYFNQKEAWMPFEWPGQTLENVTRVEWQTARSGLQSSLDAQGRFGLIRLLERARVDQQDSARYLLTWTPDQTSGVPLRVQMRSEAGSGPLEVLQLRHFTLPPRIFATGSTRPSNSPRRVNARTSGAGVN